MIPSFKYVGYKSLSSSIENLLLSKFSKNSASKLEIKLFLSWKEIVGLEIAQFTRIEKLIFQDNYNSSTLYIVVNNSGVALSLQHMIPMILEKIAVFFGYKAVSSVRIKQKNF